MNTAYTPRNQATALTKRLIAQQIKPLALVFFVGCLISLQLEDMVKDLGTADDSSRWQLQLGMGLTDMIQGIAIFLVLAWGIPKVVQLRGPHFETRPFDTPYLGSFFAEYMRMLAYVLVGGLLLLLPGLYAYVVLMFVPYIALFSKPYRAGEIHALRYSHKLTKKYFWPILGVFVASTALQTGLEFLPHMVMAFYSWPVRILLALLSFFVGAWTFAYMFTLFERAVLEEQDGPNV